MTTSLLTMHLMELAAEEEVARVNAYREAWKWYYGQHPKSLRVRPGQPDDNVTVNFLGVLVDTGVDFLFGKDVTSRSLARRERRRPRKPGWPRSGGATARGRCSKSSP